ncbi:MAG: hypothetical protein KC636_23465 [Myxococcales bacterium]|nr:hypothetical protein [Myxococcales bacterium]
MTEETGEAWADRLDRLAEAVFGGALGRARAAPLLAEHDAIVGRIVATDEHCELLRSARVDWALCEATPAGAAPGESWAYRAATGRIPGLAPLEEHRALAGSIAGVFEVLTGPWLRERLRGVVVALADPVDHALLVDEGLRLWLTRIVVVDGRARLCRRPIPLPEEIAPLLDRVRERRLDPSLDLRPLYRACLELGRPPRRRARDVFAAALA